jgi:hypothetical protein
MRISTFSGCPLAGGAEAEPPGIDGAMPACQTTVARPLKMRRPIKNAQVFREFLSLNGRSPRKTNYELQITNDKLRITNYELRMTKRDPLFSTPPVKMCILAQSNFARKSGLSGGK